MKYFIIAGEASGDLHASNLMRELKTADSDAEFCFLGGDLMQAQGGTMIKHYRQMAFMGFVAVLRNIRKVLNNMAECRQAIVDFRPDVVILIDYPSFNLRIARFVKENLQTPVIYYIPPKIWAWKEFRIKQIKKYVDKIFTIFPFETEFYRKHNYVVDYVGNPTVDNIAERPNQQQTFAEFCILNNLPEKPFIALLAGSRKQEISACLPRMIEAASRFPDYQIVLSGAPGIDADYYNQFSSASRLPVLFNQTYDLVSHASVAIVNSGTATLETALIGTPQVIVYYVMLGRIGYIAKELILKIKYISLVNLVANKEVVKELIAHFFTTDNITEELEKILNNNEYRKKIHKDYAMIQQILGEPGTAQRAAKKMLEYLGS